MNTKIIVIAVIGAIVIGGGSFYAGTKFASNDDARPNFAEMGQAGGQMRGAQNATGDMPGRQGAMGGGTIGEITAMDDTSITVRLANGESRTVVVSSTTSVSKMSAGSVANLVIGENVMVMGATNPDGSVNAESIQLGSMTNFRQPQGSPVR